MNRVLCAIGIAGVLSLVGGCAAPETAAIGDERSALIASQPEMMVLDLDPDCDISMRPARREVQDLKAELDGSYDVSGDDGIVLTVRGRGDAESEAAGERPVWYKPLRRQLTVTDVGGSQKWDAIIRYPRFSSADDVWPSHRFEITGFDEESDGRARLVVYRPNNRRVRWRNRTTGQNREYLVVEATEIGRAQLVQTPHVRAGEVRREDREVDVFRILFLDERVVIRVRPVSQDGGLTGDEMP